MSDSISFNLFGEGGFINPGSMDRLLSYARFHSYDFDGGWRWFDAYEVEALTIYNRRLNRQAYYHLRMLDIQGTRLQPEVLLMWAKAMVIIEHLYYENKFWLEDHIRALARHATIEIKKEICGDDSPHLHSVR